MPTKFQFAQSVQFWNISQAFVFNQNMCGMLQNFQDINVQFIQKEDEENHCDLKVFLANFTTCTHAFNYNLNINANTINFQDRTPKKNSQKLIKLVSQQVFHITGVKSVSIDGIQMEQLQKGISFVNINSVNLSNSKFTNNIFKKESPIVIVQSQNVSLNNVEFTQNQNEETSAALQIIRSDYISMQNCLFQENETGKPGPVFTLAYSKNITIENSKFIKNKSQKDIAGVGLLAQIEQLNVISCNFTENIAQNSAGVFFMTSVKNSLFKDSKFIKNFASNTGGCICPFGGSIEMVVDNCFFQENEASSGGALYIIHLINLKIFGSTFVGNIGKVNGGAFSVQQVKNLFLNNNSFSNNIALQGGGGAFEIKNFVGMNSTMGFQISDCSFMNNRALQGGGIFISQIKKINDTINNMSNLTFEGNLAISGNGGGVYLENIFSQLKLNNFVFKGNFAQVEGGGMACYNVISLQVQNPQFLGNKAQLNGGGVFVGRKSKNMQIKDGLFVKNNAHQQGGGIKFSETSLTVLENIIFKENQAQKMGGSISLEESEDIQLLAIQNINNTSYQGAGFTIDKCTNIELNSVVFQQNFAQNLGAGAFIIQSREVYLNNTKAINNLSRLNVGGISIQLSNYTNIVDSVFLNNTAYGEIGGLSVEMSKNTRFVNVKIINNTGNAKCGGISLYQSDVVQFSQVMVTNNTNKISQGGGIFIYGGSEISFNNSQISFNTCPLNGGGISAISCNDIEFIESVVQENQSLMQSAGGLFIQQSENIKLNKTKILKNSAKINGGGGLFINVQKTEINNSQIQENLAEKGSGGGLKLENSGEFISTNSEITLNTGDKNGGGLQLDTVSKFQITSVLAQNNTANFNGSNFNFNNVQIVEIDSGIIQHNKGGVYGGGLKIQKGKTVNIKKSKISSNSASKSGGSVYIENISNFSIKNSVFENNFAEKEMGGHVYLDSASVLNLKDSQFLEGTAVHRGGGLYVLNVLDLLIEKSVFNNNQVYFDKQLSLEKKNQDYNLTFGGSIYFEPKSFKLSDKSHFSISNSNIQSSIASSGGGILINGKTGQKIEIQMKNNSFQNNIADIGPSVRFLGNFTENTQNQIQIMYKSDQNRGNQGKISQKQDIYFGYFENERVIQQEFSDFTLCQKGSYLENGGEPLCGKCLSNGICDGGYIPVYPKQGYWRDSKDSFNFYHCEKNPDLCLGRDQCEEGHVGLFCELCDRKNKFSLESTSQTCKLCDSNDVHIMLRLVTLVLVFMVFLSGQIYGITIRINKRLTYQVMNMLFNIPFTKISQLSASTKIFVMHFQVLYLILSYELKELKYFTTSFAIIGSPQIGFTRSLECLIEFKENEQNNNLNYYITLYGFCVLMGTVVVVIILENIFYFFKKFIKDRMQLLEYIEATVLCFFLLVQPTIIQTSLSYLKAREVNGVDYCQADSNILMDSDYYRNEIFPINIAVSICLGLLFPFFLVQILARGNRKQKLQRVSFQRKYGILFLEYKDKNFYWEVIITLIKSIVVLLSTLLNDELALKGILTIFLMVGYMFICFKVQPFKTKNLNQMAIFSCLTLIFSVGCLLGVENSDINESVKQVTSVLVLGTNFLYVLFVGSVILSDFKMIFRVKLLQFCRYFKRFEGLIKDQGVKEMKAKKRWAMIKLSIQQTNQKKKQMDQDKTLSYYEQQMISNYSERSIHQHDHSGQEDTTQNNQTTNILKYMEIDSTTPDNRKRQLSHFSKKQINSQKIMTPEMRPASSYKSSKRPKRISFQNATTAAPRKESSNMQFSYFDTNLQLPKSTNNISHNNNNPQISIIGTSPNVQISPGREENKSDYQFAEGQQSTIFEYLNYDSNKQKKPKRVQEITQSVKLEESVCSSVQRSLDNTQDFLQSPCIGSKRGSIQSRRPSQGQGDDTFQIEFQ